MQPKNDIPPSQREGNEKECSACREVWLLNDVETMFPSMKEVLDKEFACPNCQAQLVKQKQEEEREPDPKNDLNNWNTPCGECDGLADERTRAGLKCGRCSSYYEHGVDPE